MVGQYLLFFQVDKLARWCSGDSARIDYDVRNVMRALFSNALAEKLSLSGRNGKEGIITMVLFEVICGKIVRRVILLFLFCCF